MDTLLDNMKTQLEDAHAKASAITQRAADDNRDLNDAEQHNFDAYKEQIETLQPRIEHLVETQRSFDASASALATVTGNNGANELMRREAPAYMANTYRSTGEWMVDYLTAKHPGGGQNAPSHEARAAAADRLKRAVANQTVADNLGIIPENIVGPVVNYMDNRRSVWNSFTQRTITSGPLFNRPRVTQHTLVGKQTTEKTELSSRKMLIERVPVTVDTYGGVIDVSLQDQYWSDPSIMSVLVDDLRAMYVTSTETVAAALLTTNGTANSVNIGTTPTGAQLITAIYTAATAVFTGLGLLPTHLGMSADVWARFGGLADSAGRPLFPTLNPSNASASQSADSFAGTVAGLSVVVSGGLAANSLYVYRGDAFEAWEQLIGVLQMTEPRLLGTELAYAGFAAVLALHAEAAQKLTFAP